MNERRVERSTPLPDGSSASPTPSSPKHGPQLERGEPHHTDTVRSTTVYIRIMAPRRGTANESDRSDSQNLPGERERAGHHDTPARVSVHLVRGLVEVLRARNIALDALLGSATDPLIGAPADSRISLERFHALVARAISLSGEPALGLVCGLQASESSFGVISPLVSHARSLRDAIRLVSSFNSLLFDDVSVALDEHPPTASVRLEFLVPIEPSVVELLVSGLVRNLRSFGCSDADFHSVRFKYPRPRHYEAYNAVFRGAERFEQPFTGVEIPAHILDHPHMHYDAELQALLRTQAERTLDRLVRPLDFIERVRLAMSERRDKQVPDMDTIARALGLSTRSLRRRLEDEGTSFRALRDSFLYESACSMLSDPNVNLQTVAHDLGFADPAAFHRAFKRWSGLNPGDYRKATMARRSI